MMCQTSSLGTYAFSAGLNMRNGREHAAAVWLQNRIVYLATPGGCQRANKAARVSLHAEKLAFAAASCLSIQTSNAGSSQ